MQKLVSIWYRSMFHMNFSKVHKLITNAHFPGFLCIIRGGRFFFCHPSLKCCLFSPINTDVNETISCWSFTYGISTSQVSFFSLRFFVLFFNFTNSKKKKRVQCDNYLFKGIEVIENFQDIVQAITET